MAHRWMRTALIATILLVAGCYAPPPQPVQAPPPVPAAPVESVPPQPSPAHVWIPGWYAPGSLRPERNVWVPGPWTIAPWAQVWAVPGAHPETLVSARPTGLAPPKRWYPSSTPQCRIHGSLTRVAPPQNTVGPLPRGPAEALRHDSVQRGPCGPAQKRPAANLQRTCRDSNFQPLRGAMSNQASYGPEE
jgi:hypothetical protein